MAAIAPPLAELAVGEQQRLDIISIGGVLLAGMFFSRWIAASTCTLAIATEIVDVLKGTTTWSEVAYAAVGLVTFAVVGSVLTSIAADSRRAASRDSDAGNALQLMGERDDRPPHGIGRRIEVLGLQVLDEDAFSRLTGPLSHRQREVVRLAIGGLTAVNIGARLFISERTVETHLANAYERLGVHSRAALIAMFSIASPRCA